MQSPNPHIYDGDYLDLDYRTPSLPLFDSPGGSLAEPSQAPSGTRKLPLLQSKDWDSDFEDNETNPTCIHYDIEWKLPSFKQPRVQAVVDVVRVCGPIVDVVDGYVQFVHFTVREYIFSTKVENYLPISEMALDLAIRCMVYLCQDHHEPDLTEDEIDANILWGAYRLHYFSSGFWLDLINEYLTLSSSATLPNTLIDQLRVLFGTRQSEDHTQTDQDATCLHPAILALESREPVLVEILKSCTAFQTSSSKSDFHLNNCCGSTPAHSLFPKFPSLSIVGWTILLNRDNHEKHRQKPWNCNYPGCRYATNGFISRKMSDHHLKDGHSHIADPPLPKPAPTEKIADEEIQPLMFDLIETNQVEAITSLIPRLDNLGRPVQRELSIHAARMGSSSILQLFDDCCLLKRAFLTDSHLEWKEFRQLASLAVRSESVSSSKVLLCWVAALDLPVVKDRAYFAITIMNILSANLVVESQELFDLWRPSLCSGFEIPDMAVDTANGLAMQGNIISTDNISNREHMLLGIWEELNILDTITARTRHSILA
ncbi:hypothetical protein FOFC_16160 [Fusarium oxysporum]|nr:hypothetical protein FOFC_16160 [Fusarium oxysporum]